MNGLWVVLAFVFVFEFVLVFVFVFAFDEVSDLMHN